MRGRAMIGCEAKRAGHFKAIHVRHQPVLGKKTHHTKLCLWETSVTFPLSSLSFCFWPTKIVMLIIKIIITANIYWVFCVCLAVPRALLKLLTKVDVSVQFPRLAIWWINLFAANLSISVVWLAAHWAKQIYVVIGDEDGDEGYGTRRCVGKVTTETLGCVPLVIPTDCGDQALSLWSRSTDSKTLNYQRTNPREYQISENSHRGNHLNTRPGITQPPCAGHHI